MPVRTSSLSLSKYTTYESTVTPTDTMMPVTPANDSVSPCALDRYDTTEKNNIPVSTSPAITTSPSSR